MKNVDLLGIPILFHTHVACPYHMPPVVLITNHNHIACRTMLSDRLCLAMNVISLGVFIRVLVVCNVVVSLIEK